jgi:coatomer subunit beta
MSELPCYTILHLPPDLEAPNEQQLKADLEKGDTKTKTIALKKVLHLILNGDKIPGLLMTIIRFVLPSQV